MSIPVVGRSPIIVSRRYGDDGPAVGQWGAGDRGGWLAVARRHGELRAAILAFMIVLAVLLGGVQAVPTRFSASSVVSLMPRPAAIATADTVRLLGGKYVVLATSATIMQTVADSLQTEPEGLAADTTASLDSGTGNLEVAVVRPSRQEAVDAANALAGALVRRSRYDGLVQAEATSPATSSRVVSTPARPLLRTAGVAAALLVAFLVWTLARGRRSTRPAGASRRLAVEGAW